MSGQRATHAEDTSSDDVELQTLQQYTNLHSSSSNDCDWIHQFLTSDAIPTNKVDPLYLIRLYYKDPTSTQSTACKDFGCDQAALLELGEFLPSVDVCAVILCHRESSQVDPKILELLWAKFSLDVSFMRHHFDYKEFRKEQGCSESFRTRLDEETGYIEESWTYGGRWNPVRLPSETNARILRLTVASECLSVIRKGNVVIALVRSKAIYEIPQPNQGSPHPNMMTVCPSKIDLYAATIDSMLGKDAFSRDIFHLSHSIVHFYARLLVLRCYEDYVLRHDVEPIHIAESGRVCTVGRPHLEAIRLRQLELVKLKQNLSAYLGPSALGQSVFTDHVGIHVAKHPNDHQLRGLLADVDMLLSLYDFTMEVYHRNIQEVESSYRAELASEQLEETKASKATAISLGKLSAIAFVYLPINSACTMLGMNLSIFGQGTVPIWVFFLLLALFGLITSMPFLSGRRLVKKKVEWYKVAYHLTKRSPSAGFWLLAFFSAHSFRQNQVLVHSGFSQTLLGGTHPRTKGWILGKNDQFFQKSTWGNQKFWEGKVKLIYLAVKEVDVNSEVNGPTV